MKRKVTDYFRIMAPRLTGGKFVVKRYRREDHRLEAIAASLQEKPLKGQTAALFTVPQDVEKVEVRFTKTKGAVVSSRGVQTWRLLFNKKAFLDDWKAEVHRVLEAARERELARNRERRKVRRMVAGKKLRDQLQKQGKPLTRAELAKGRRGRVR